MIKDSPTVRDHLRDAYRCAWSWSQDNNTKVGALIVDEEGIIYTYGANVFIKGLETQEKPLKYKLIEHAEARAIHEAAKLGIGLDGKILVSTWACCSNCARAIVFSGIKKVITHGRSLARTPERWREDIEIGLSILAAGGVELELFYPEVGGCTNMFNGVEWRP